MTAPWGIDAALFYGTTVAAESWTEMDQVKELEPNIEIDEADATKRAHGGWKASVGKLKQLTFSFTHPYDTALAAFIALQASFFDDTPIALASFSGDYNASLTVIRGIKADCCVTKLAPTQNADNIQVAEIEAEPTPSTTPPAWWITCLTALPAEAETVNANYIDLGPGTPVGTVKIAAPALTTAELPDTQTMIYLLQTDDNAAFSTPTTLVAAAITQTGAAGAGDAAETYSVAMPAGAQRYLRVTITKSGVGDASAKKARFSVVMT